MDASTDRADDGGPRLTLRAVVVDCVDAERLASFWSALLQRPILGRTGPYVWIAEVDSVELVFQRVSALKRGKSRLHLDLAANDPLAEQQRVESLGGLRLHEYDDGGFLVMADLEGNEFCLIPRGPVGIDDAGRAHYLDGGLGPGGSGSVRFSP